MGRYLLGYLRGYLLCCLAAWGMAALAMVNWFFSEPPLWFSVLTLVSVLLPCAAAGALAARRSGEGGRFRLGLALTLAAMALLWAARALGADMLLLVNLPCYLPGEMAADWLELNRRWGYQVYDRFLRHLLALAGHASLPLLYRLFWGLGRRGGAKNKG